ncbi:MAG: alpha/beta fold hydrolase [Acidimicrobiales bacterium]
MDGFWETSERLGGTFNPYQAGFAQQICVAETDAHNELLDELGLDRVDVVGHSFGS